MSGTFTKLMNISQQKSASDSSTSQNRTEIRSEHRSSAESPQSTELPYKRATKRYSFEFYIDQVETIRKMRLQAQIEGKNLNQSDIVRQALDEYLQKQSQ